MKNCIYLLTACLGVLFLTACQPKPETTKAPTLKQKDTIPVSTYNNWTQAWEDKGQKYTDSILTKYFTMPLIDLTEFSTSKHAAARFVLGLDTTTAPYTPHLMLVGVDSTGATMVPPAFPNANIYDVTRPCPNMCGGNGLPN